MSAPQTVLQTPSFNLLTYLLTFPCLALPCLAVPCLAFLLTYARSVPQWARRRHQALLKTRAFRESLAVPAFRSLVLGGGRPPYPLGLYPTLFFSRLNKRASKCEIMLLSVRTNPQVREQPPSWRWRARGHRSGSPRRSWPPGCQTNPSTSPAPRPRS